MKNLNKKTEFDRQWEDVFRDGELAPPEGIWDKIDSALSKEEAGYFKKRAFLFKLLAAASIIFALGVGIFSINYYLGQGESQVLVQDNGVEEIRSDTENSLSASEVIIESKDQSDSETPKGGTEFGLKEGQRLVENANRTELNNGVIGTEDSNLESALLISENSNDSKGDMEGELVHSHEYPGLSEIENRGILTNNGENLVYQIDHIYLIPIMPRGASKKKREKDYGEILAGLDFSTGIFDPNFQQGNSVFASTGGSTFADARVESVNDQLASFSTTNKDFLLVRSTGQETKPEVAYSYGANVGFRLSKRFIVQTGLSYRKANTTTTTTGYIENGDNNSQIPIVAAYQYQLGGLSSVKRIPETNLNNQYEFASIPVRAGYIFLDKKVNLALMAGISSEFFLNNQIESNNDEFETLSSSGNGSPYKNVYFNGSLGTMLGYSFAENYQITLEPSYRFAVNSFTKDDFYLNSYPSSFMISFGVAYNFK